MPKLSLQAKSIPFRFIHFFAILVVYVMMTHFDYNSNTNPPHMKLKITENSISQMITQVQSSLLPTQKSQGMATLRPWYFKPKKTLYSDGDDLIIKKKKKFNSLHWTYQENYRYAQFLGKYLALVQGEVIEKRKFHLNRMMSKHIKTRSPVQCRSHHQKILKSFKTIEGIIEYFQNQPPAEISANSQAQESKGDANDEIISDQVQINSYIENNEEEVELENRENFLQSSFNRMFDIIRAPEDVFSERGVYSFPQLDSYQV